jgi:hypothetical protein
MMYAFLFCTEFMKGATRGDIISVRQLTMLGEIPYMDEVYTELWQVI